MSESGNSNFSNSQKEKKLFEKQIEEHELLADTQTIITAEIAIVITVFFKSL